MPTHRTTAAHVPLVALTVALVVAVILGFATGSLNEDTLKRPIAQPGDKVTVP